LDEETTKIFEDEIYKKVEESLNTDEVKLEMNARIEEGCHNLINGVAMQLTKEIQYKIQEGHQKILEKIELLLEDVHAKYDGIISKDRVIKDKEKRIEDYIVSEKNIYEMNVQSEGKSSNVKPYLHPH
jgi:hypothetical protein